MVVIGIDDNELNTYSYN